jgi:hypothetical protein
MGSVMMEYFGGCYDPMRQIAAIDPANDAQG